MVALLRLMMLMIEFFLVLAQFLFCSGLVINPSSGSTRGDPAPGRSPGPPPLLSSTSPAQAPTAPNLISNGCTLNGNETLLTNEPLINVTFTHEKFKADEELVAGILYQVVVKRKKPETHIKFTITSTMEVGLPAGQFTSSNIESYNCDSHIIKSQFKITTDPIMAFNWTIKRNKEMLKSVNLTFEINYKVEGDLPVYRLMHTIPLSQECHLWLKKEEAVVTSYDFPHFGDCQVWFPNHGLRHGLVVELTRLNVPCSRGYIHFTGLNTSQHQHFRSHRQTHLCGKLEELPESDRHIYLPSSPTPPFMHFHGNPIFSLSYHLVDYCYNVTFLTKNGSFELKPTGEELHCTFKIYMPYGYRVALNLQIGDSTSTSPPGTDSLTYEDPNTSESNCDGLLAQLFDGDNHWSHCTLLGDAERRIEMVSRENKVVLKVKVYKSNSDGALGFRMAYKAAPIEDIVGVCGFGWVAVNQFCVSAIEGAKLPWNQAEMECVRRGGHLASIRNEHAQNIVDNLLVNSPGYRDHNAYWIGASDKIHEGDFRWVDGLPFSYTNWFPGWFQHGHYNRQPNDDGLSEQDCVEVRRIYSLPTSAVSLTSTFMWNDRDCRTPNYFICERLQNDEPLEDGWPPDCNGSVDLSPKQSRAVVSSPGFPRQYPDNAECDTDIVAPPGYRLVLDFEELVLENEPSCSYDYLEIIENTTTSTNSSIKRLCGDWSTKLKLLRYVSHGSKVKLRFSSDYSHHFGGFKARVSMESAMHCTDDRLQMFNNSCYLFVSHPEVTWNIAQQICEGYRGNLASISSADEERFITANIRKTPEYRNNALYWLGSKAEKNSKFKWIDGKSMDYSGFLPGEKVNFQNNENCLAIQWRPSPTIMLPSGLYWTQQKCSNIGGYVCKMANLLSGMGINFNKTVNGTEGNLTTPHYPDNYYNNLDFSVKIVGGERTRIVIKFKKIDIEPQIECLYDYIELKSVNYLNGLIGDKGGENSGESGEKSDGSVKLCGAHDTEMHRFDFVSTSNELELNFHSDYSISGSGFSLYWKTVDVSACPMQTLTAIEGVLTSPNYPDFLLPYLDCTITILAPFGKRVWLEFQNSNFDGNKSEIVGDATLELSLSKNTPAFKLFEIGGLLTEGSFVSAEERLTLKLHTGDKPKGAGFRAIYKIINTVNEEKNIKVKYNMTGTLLHLNYPGNPSTNINFVQHFIAPMGHIISLDLYHLKISDKGSCFNDNGLIEVYDSYYKNNGTTWKLCYDADAEDAIIPFTPISITSFLHTLHLRQKSGPIGIPLNGTLRVQRDGTFKDKLKKLQVIDVESCNPNPCGNGGKCVTKETRRFCQCVDHFAGPFCALTKCEYEPPCVFGKCELTNTSYKCHCNPGYTGPTCEQKRKPCEGNPCESRGICLERGDGFQCRCHAWWEGPRCEKRMMHIPYKPLTERMFHEPFWLGLMTVFVVMAVIGLVWCAKRHFPEKIEKLLAEESDRNNRSTLSSLRSSSVREQLAAASGAPAVTVAPSPGLTAPRTLFGRLGIRKPSILSLTSPHASGGYVPATARTFSLDDLLKTPPRRTPSPKKKRTNSTPTKKNAAEKKQILQQLVSPGNSKLSRKVNLGDLMQMSERKNSKELDQPIIKKEVKETKFIEQENVQSALTDPKLEKKVTFARLLNKVSAEMSSSSDMDLGFLQTNRLGCVFARPSSTPPSPNVDARSPNSTSSNQGSDSFTSSDLAIPNALSSSISDLLNRSFNNKLPSRQKPASADSILAMFRNFSSSSAGINLSPSLKISPSTTPTASSPQDDMVGDEESSTSSIHTPVSLSSGPPESPIAHRQSTIEVPVLDPLSAHKSSGSNLLHPPTILLEIPSTINKCLSPIRELPTPLPSPIPSPALTPLMKRHNVSSSLEESSDDKISIEIPNISISDGDEDEIRHQDIAIDPHAEDGLILEEAAAMQKQTIKIKNRPPPLGQPSESSNSSPNRNHPPLIIPTLTIQTPSPTHTKNPTMLFPGSPPPHRSNSQQDSCFQFPSPPKTRKLYKDIDKPMSLDLPCAPPMITITCNMSEAESDIESISPAVQGANHLNVTTSGMNYLSPFSMVARGEHTASESNLSSSGYSSMASPGPSRCGSSNPLCPSEMEDQGPHGSGSHGQRRTSHPAIRTTTNTDNNDNTTTNNEQRRGRSDSETLSDDPLLESNDEGIGTDHIDEKIEEGDLKSAKELAVFMTTECDLMPFVKTFEDTERLSLQPTLSLSSSSLLSSSTTKNSLQLPSIIVQCDIDKHLSPMSSRSESPLSDRTIGIGRFSPQFYGKGKDSLPFTDSDGLYDFPSSDKVNINVTQHKKTGRKREKKLIRNCKTPSPTKSSIHPLFYNHLDVPGKEIYKVPPPRKLSPKKKTARSQVVSSSSSSDSITSNRDVRLSSSSPSPETIRWSSPITWLEEKQPKSHEASGEDTYDDANSALRPKSVGPKHPKISRLRAISHQIRFLRRLEQSLKRRERTISPSDSLDSGGDDSPRATSPLLQQKSPKVEIRKSNSIGRLQQTTTQAKNRRGKIKRNELLLPQQDQDERSWKRIVITGNGHSD